jgi:hypothetical protein
MIPDFAVTFIEFAERHETECHSFLIAAAAPPPENSPRT